MPRLLAAIARHLYEKPNVEVASRATLRILDAATPQPQSLAALAPGGIRKLTSPAGVGTVTEAPSVASPTVTGRSR